MRCRDVDALWDEIRGECTADLKETVETHVEACPSCQGLYEQYEGVAYRLSSLPEARPSCDLTKKIVEHIASLKFRARTPIVLTTVATPIGLLYVGFRENRIAYVGIDTGESAEEVRERLEHRLRRPATFGEAPAWLKETLERFFTTWRVEDGTVDLSDLTPFEQATLRATAQIPPGEVRSYGWVATQIGRPRAARAVGRVMARNPIPVLLPCHRVVDSTGDLHNYYYGLDMKERLLEMEARSHRGTQGRRQP
jgi:methylated-DNA-[protein]-cysteine S-methyltransferase